MIYAVDLLETKYTTDKPFSQNKLTGRPIYFTDLNRPVGLDNFGHAALWRVDGRTGPYRRADSFRVFVLQPNAAGTSATWELIMAGNL